ncbi:MAG: UDP-3-O-(3-hydroxymyristoyl)glucosamine N-acyltransferase [Holosporaceae bacterium]|jgi:UDP-3-O-[3-hydroxymyristoyl] glucosamine N-acyltransferase|nr:UDP-3-O-(3-hydroxymyristoyl)glucosamine N-acyltransferase [Holosporaceae bacterium]
MVDENFYGEPNRVKVSELAAVCGFKIVGKLDFEILGIATLANATHKELSFFGNRKYVNDLKNTSAGAVIIAEESLKYLPPDAVGLIYANATIGYAKALKVMYPEEERSFCICPTASIHKTAKIGVGCHIGDHVVLEENVKIGDRVIIGSNSVIEKNCRIGSGCKIRNNVTISHSILGENVLVNSGVRIGESGFGIIPTGKEMVFIRQLGRVIIGDRVRIGANTTIDRGSVQDTVIGNDSVIDNLVQIAHNVTIGERSILVAQVGIAGSTKIGNDVVLAGQVGVSGHIEIGDGAIAAAKSGIAASIGAGKIVGGIPAVEANVWKRQAAFLKMAVTRKKQAK